MRKPVEGSHLPVDVLPDNFRERLDLLRSYYDATCYSILNSQAAIRNVSGLKQIENPAHKAVEFHVAHLFPGSLKEAFPFHWRDKAEAQEDDPDTPSTTLSTDQSRNTPPEAGGAALNDLQVPDDLNPQDEASTALDRDIAATERIIFQVWEWSNWQSEKQVYVRWLARDGEAYIGAATRTDDDGNVRRVYMHLVDAYDVSDFDEDERGFLTYLRIDTELETRDNKGKTLYRTEVWDKLNNSHRVWIHDQGRDVELENLGDPQPLQETNVIDEESGERVLEETGEVDEAITDLGFDFIPYTHVRFLDTGDPRGASVFQKWLIAIDEINRAINRINDLFFQYTHDIPLVLKRNEEGRAPARLEQVRPGPNQDEESNTADPVAVGDTTLYRLPGNASLEQLVVNLPYDEGLQITRQQLDSLAEEIAELRFFDDVDKGDPSGLSRRLRLAPAEARGREARSNAENGIIRATQMCITLGQIAGLEGFTELPDFDSGGLRFEFEPRAILHVNDIERFTAEKARAETLAVYAKTIPLPLFEAFLKQMGYSEEVVNAVVASAEASQQQSLPIPQLASLLDDNPTEPPEGGET